MKLLIAKICAQTIAKRYAQLISIHENETFPCLTERRRRRRRRKERKNRRIISGNSLFQFEQPVNKHRREIEERDSFDVFTVAYRANEKT